MPILFYNLQKNVLKVFSRPNLFWHLAAIAATSVLVVSGFDWAWAVFFRHSAIYPFFFPEAGIIGFFLPVLIPLAVLIIGEIRKDKRLINTAWALGQAALVAVLIAAFYKAFTGRVGPELTNIGTLEDISKVFRFGILRGGIFWGWPSSHTSVAVAMATTTVVLYPKNKTAQTIALLLAFYISFGAAISFHWFSDAVAGTIFGMLIGKAVGKSFLSRLQKS